MIQKKYPKASVSGWYKYTSVDLMQLNSSRSKHLIARRITVGVFRIGADVKGQHCVG